MPQAKTTQPPYGAHTPTTSSIYAIGQAPMHARSALYSPTSKAPARLIVARDVVEQLQHVQEEVDDVEVQRQRCKDVLLCGRAAGWARRWWVWPCESRGVRAK